MHDWINDIALAFQAVSIILVALGNMRLSKRITQLEGQHPARQGYQPSHVIYDEHHFYDDRGTD